MVALLPDDCLQTLLANGNKILDIAGKAGEFALAFCDRYAKMGIAVDLLENTIYTIPTSGLTYEFTRMVYEILGLNTDCIATRFTSYSLMSVHKQETRDMDYDKIRLILSQDKPLNEITLTDEVAEGDEKVKFDVVVGNPPYQKNDGGNKASAVPIYDKLVLQSTKMNASFASLIIPAKWFNGGRGLDEFRAQMLSDASIRLLVDFKNSEDCFPGVDVAGGICYFLRENGSEGSCIVREFENGKFYESMRNLNEYATFIRSTRDLPVLEKVTANNHSEYLYAYVSSQKPFGLRTYVKPQEGGDLFLRYSGGLGPYHSSIFLPTMRGLTSGKLLCHI